MKKQTKISESFAPEKIERNHATMDYCRNFLSIVAGIAAGVLGLTGLWGLGVHFLCSVLISTALYLKAGMDPSYFISLQSFFLGGLTSGMGSYILVWTMAYDIVHIYG